MATTLMLCPTAGLTGAARESEVEVSDPYLSVCGEWVAQGQIEGNWESGTAIIGDRTSRGGAVLRGMEFSWCRDPEALMFSLKPFSGWATASPALDSSDPALDTPTCPDMLCSVPDLSVRHLLTPAGAGRDSTSPSTCSSPWHSCPAHSPSWRSARGPSRPSTCSL